MKRKVKIKTGARLLNYSATMRGFEKDGELLMVVEEAMERSTERCGWVGEGWSGQRGRSRLAMPKPKRYLRSLPSMYQDDTTNADSM